MELGLCLTCQTLRRAGKRFVVSKLSSGSHTSNEDTKLRRDFELKKDHFQKIIVTPNSTSKILMRNTYFSIKPLNVLQAGTRKSDAILTKVKQFSSSCALFTARKIHTINTSEWIDQNEIVEVLEMSKLPYKKRYTSYETICKGCCKDHKTTSESTLSLLINSRNGNNICRKCGVTSSWEEFKKIVKMSSFSKTDRLKPLEFDIVEIDNKIPKKWADSMEFADRYTSGDLRNTLKIKESVLTEFGVRTVNEENEMTFLFPYYDITKMHLMGLKIYNSTSEKWTVFQRQQKLGLFGWNVVHDKHTKVVLTSHEFDSLAVTQATGLPSLALPLGASALPPECLPYLEQFDDVVMWFRNEYQARQNVHRFAMKLGLSRCSLVSANCAAYDLLIRNGGEAVEKILTNASVLFHDHIVTFKELSSELYCDLMNTKQNAGVPFTRFPVLNEYLKGHRRGELTIFTGPTGSGKTTFLSELSLDLSMQGVRTLWGSFEIKNVRLANIMMHQLSGFALENYMSKFDEWSEKFESLPMYFMNYYGATDLKQVIETIQYAVYKYDIEHVVIDNLQFMTMVSSGEDRFQLMDKAVAAFRSCASENHIHITIVVHPRKENDGSLLQTASIYGSAKASQEADNVLILQNSEKLSMQVSKNRFCGAVGSIPLSFHPESLCLSGFHRNDASSEAILPALKVKRPIQNIKVIRKSPVQT